MADDFENKTALNSAAAPFNDDSAAPFNDDSAAPFNDDSAAPFNGDSAAAKPDLNRVRRMRGWLGIKSSVETHNLGGGGEPLIDVDAPNGWNR